tara:strand:- start:7903 stop:8379 length:477 start_codon:yes stop_codon:yes gene_type:complete
MHNILFYLSQVIKLFTDIVFSSRVRISGSSMEPSMFDGDMFLATKSKYRMINLKNDDVIFFHHPLTNLYYVKRIVATPEDVVQLSSNAFLINDVDYGKVSLSDKGDRSNVQKWTLKKDEYFVLGDNYNNSTDSRVLGPINVEWILGIIWYQYYSAKNR